ncbi:hypothetical protein Tco_0924749 [Tanacetum coccineum]|uniref:Integrase, catalytic region, zinc finger, CCHC-type, peptidase aspartic, catalytic n=1 Tax=Tanacetum coccineum TaxID=301880 RepID=A0ABQ5D673_9ASTR
MTTLTEFMILSAADNRPPMLEKDLYDSWKGRMELYMQNREHGRMILEFVEHSPLIWPMIEEMVNTKFLNSLPPEWSKFVTDVKFVKDLHTTNFDQLNAYLEQHELYANEVRIMRERSQDPLALVANHQMTSSHFNTYQSSYNNPQSPFPNAYSSTVHQDACLQPQSVLNGITLSHTVISTNIFWLKFPTIDSGLVVPGRQNSYAASTSGTRINTSGTGGNYLGQQRVVSVFKCLWGRSYGKTVPKAKEEKGCYMYSNAYSSTVHQEASPQPQFVPQIKYIVSIVNQQIHLAEFPQIDSGLAVPVFKQGDDLIDAINKMMSFLSTIVTSRFPYTNNQLRNSSNPRQQATIFLNEEELEFLVDLGIAEGTVTQSVITHNAPYQADDLDSYDSDSDKISTAKEILMANLSSYRSYVLSEVPIYDNTNNDMLNQSEQEMSYSKPSHFVEHLENEIHSDSNIIPYSQYLIESQNAVVQDTNSSAQQDALILSMFEQLSNQVTNCNKVNKDNLIANESLSAELERYKELKAQQIRPTLYDDNVIAKETNVISIADSKETLMLEEESRSKMLLKQSDSMVVEKKVNIKPINYAELNRLSEDFDTNTSMDVNSSVAMNDSVNYVEMCNKCLDLEAENNTSVNQIEPLFDQLFELNNLKAELQAKDTTIKKLKAYIKRVHETSTSESVKRDIDESETINIELEHRVAKIIAEDEHLKQTYKQLYDSIKPSRVRAKEQVDSLVNQLNQKSIEITDLNAQLQEKVFVITTLKNNLRKFKGNDIVDNAAQALNATTIAPGMYKLDPVTLAPKVKNNRESHEYYLKHTMEQAAILREIVEQAKSLNPLDRASYSACKYVKLIQELLGYIKDTCPDIHKPSEKLVAVTAINKKKTVRFADTVTSSGNIPKVTNRPLLSSIEVNPSTSASKSKPSGNTKNDRILRTLSNNEKNKVEVQFRKVKSSLNKRNSNSKNVCSEHVKHHVKGVKALCSVCNECLFDANHAMCLIDHVNKWNPVHLKDTILQLLHLLLFLSIAGCPNCSVFGNDQVAKIMGYGYYQIGNVRISRVYYVEGLGCNLFSVGQFYDSYLEVAF